MPKWVRPVWMPDRDCSWEVAPGALVECRGFVPRRRGTYATFAMENEIASYTSTTEPVASCITRKADGTARFFIFNKQSIFEFTSTSAATDRSSATYSASTTGWTWAQYGDVTIATNLYNNVQQSSAGAFADLAGSPPKAQIVLVTLGQIMLLNYNDGSAYPAGWYCSDYDDATDWTITATNGADKGNLYDTPGPIRAAKMLRDSVVAYKDDSIYVGDFVGDPSTTIWSWRLVSDSVGCSSLHGVAVLNDKHYFMHRSGFYEFDGAAVRKIGRECTNFLFDGITGADPLTCRVAIDQREGVVCFGWSATAGKVDVQAYYNTETGMWSYNLGQTFTAGAIASYYATATVACNQSDILAFDSSGNDESVSTLVMIGKSNTTIAANSMTYPAIGGVTTSPVRAMRTGAIGDSERTYRLNGFKLRMNQAGEGDTAPTATFNADNSEYAISYNLTPPETPDTVATATWNDKAQRFDGKAAGRYLNADMSFNNYECEIGGLMPILQDVGSK